MISRPRRAVLPLLAVGLFLSVTGCAQSPSTSAPVPTKSAAPAAAASNATWTPPTNGSTVDVTTFATAVSQSGVIVLDVRTPAEFAAGHLPDAQHLDVNAPDFTTTLTTLPTDAVYAVYCHSGNRSGTAVDQMVDLGFTHVFHLGGGITAWQGSGQAVIR